jgi:hypothetical protein
MSYSHKPTASNSECYVMQEGKERCRACEDAERNPLIEQAELLFQPRDEYGWDEWLFMGWTCMMLERL